METELIINKLIELLELAKDFGSVENIDPKLPPFTAVITIIARRDFPILHSMGLLANDSLSGDAILDLSRRLFEDMISVEFMVIKGKEDMAVKFVKFYAVERWLNLEYLRKMGVKVAADLEKEVEDQFQEVKPDFIFKGDEVAQSWSKTRLENMIEELVKAKVITDAETANLLQGYILGNKKNHLSSEDTSAFAEKKVRENNLNHSLRIGLVIAIVSYLKILSKYTEETGNNNLSDKVDKLFNSLNVPSENPSEAL